VYFAKGKLHEINFRRFVMSIEEKFKTANNFVEHYNKVGLFPDLGDPKSSAVLAKIDSLSDQIVSAADLNELPKENPWNSFFQWNKSFAAAGSSERPSPPKKAVEEENAESNSNTAVFNK
jgi:hypothetical protein